MATYLNVLNDVLVRLRRDTVVDVGGTDVKLIAALVNVAKNEVEDSFKWNALRTSLDVAVTASDKDYSLTDFGERFVIEKVWDISNDLILRQTDHLWIDKQRELGNSNEAQPGNWAISGVDANGDPTMELWPTPSASLTLRVWAHVPTTKLTANSDQVKVPSLPIVLKAYQLALHERGEDGGIDPTSAKAEFDRALDNAIARENLAQRGGHNTDWYVASGPRA